MFIVYHNSFGVYHYVAQYGAWQVNDAIIKALMLDKLLQYGDHGIARVLTERNGVLMALTVGGGTLSPTTRGYVTWIDVSDDTRLVTMWKDHIEHIEHTGDTT